MIQQRGSISFMGIFFMFLCSTALLGSVYIYQTTLFEIKNRAKKYLCLKLYLKKSEIYISQISKLNMAIQAANVASLIPSTAAAAQQTLRALKIAQNFLHLSYLSKLTSNEFCSRLDKSTLVAKLPYKTRGLFKLYRTGLGITQVRKKKWVVILFATNGYLLKANLKLKGPYTMELPIQSKEMPFWNH